MITQKRLKELVEYKDGDLYWLRNGGRVGHTTEEGYRRCTIDTKKQYVHRLIWLYHYGVMPDKIDHKDHNTSNNALSNLREATTKVNGENRLLSSNNRSGHIGVYYDNTAGKWRVSIARKHRGYFVDKDEAIAKAKEVYAELGYHSNHGKEK